MNENKTNKLSGLGSFRMSFQRNKDRMRSNNKTGMKMENNNQSSAEKQLPPLPSRPADIQPDQSNCCIICVGSTGTGKSSTVGKYTGVQTRAGSGTERVTMHCEIHRSLTNDQEPVWVDTVGWDDAECEDDQTFKDILGFINKYDITKVNTIKPNTFF